MTRNVLRWAVYAIVIGAALGGVYVATRGTSAPAPAATAHNHGAAPTGDSLRAIALSGDEARRIGVTYVPVVMGSFEKEVRTVGQVTYDETRVHTITSKIDGFVERLHVNATGQYVAADEPLFAIYSPMLVSAQEELLLAKRLQRDVANGDTDAQRNASELTSAARRRLAYWDIPEKDIVAVEQSGEVQRTLTLRSAASGFVIEKNVTAGQRIMAGDPLYRVVDLSDVWVEGEVFEQDLATVHVGQTVHADFAALPDDHRMGRISYIYPTINPDTRTARVRVVLPNGNLRLKPGMYATVRITGIARASVLTVPRDAVLSTGERNIVFVKTAGGRLSPREVALGPSNDARVEVLRGLSVGDTVVGSATFLVDAESNLGKALGGMGDMPGMDMSEPPKPLPMQPTKPAAKDDPHAGHKMP